MRDVALALVPAVIASGIIFGLRAIVIILLSVLSSMGFEYLSRRIMKRNNTLSDWTAVITGVLLAFNLPPTIPYYMVVIGAFFAIVVVKQMFGGLGNNFVNPALAARIILSIAFPKAMTNWAYQSGPFDFVKSLTGADLVSSATKAADAVSSATPLAILKAQGSAGAPALPSYLSLFLGDKTGTIGEICIAALLIGAIYLVARKVITLWIPLTYIGTVLLLTGLAGKDPIYELLAGGLFLGAFFMATDYVTSPVTRKGRILFGIGCGVITALIRLFGNMAEGVSYSILLMNILVPHIDRFTVPKPFGEVKKHENA
jgi:electron transport complex protein RnfD